MVKLAFPYIIILPQVMKQLEEQKFLQLLVFMIFELQSDPCKLLRVHPDRG